MKKQYKTWMLSLIIPAVLAGCSQSIDSSAKGDQQQPVKQEVQEGKKIVNIEAKEEHWMYNDKLMDMAWTYNGMVPGQEIRVKEGDEVVIQFKNSLPEPSALHLHGLPVPNEMDGVPGITQNAVMPGKIFNYEFTADTPGTYWYHSHQNGSEQVDKGLYGVVIIEPKDGKAYDIDKTIVLDEWSSMAASMNGGSMDHSNMKMSNNEMDHSNMNMDSNGMDHGNMNMGNQNAEHVSHTEMMKQMYDNLIVNGKAAPKIEPIQVKEGNTVKLRFLNAGLFTQVVSIPGEFKVTHYDGQEVSEPQLLSKTSLRIAPAERYDIELNTDQPGAWGIRVFAEDNKDKLNAVIPIVYPGFENKELVVADVFPAMFDLATYGKEKDINLGPITKEYNMVLGTKDGGETFTINDKKMPSHETYEVKQGDVVKVKIKNDTDVDHPMHLHGQFFYVISKNGEPFKGAPVLKDTLNVRPNETYEVVFTADNPGNWMFHCHELHHAAGGMVSEVKYEGYQPKFTIDPNIPNKPE